jgi:hypothetical protein
MSEHNNAPKGHEPHAIHEEHNKGPHDPKNVNPKIASDIAYWSKEFGVGTHVDKLRHALQPHTAA